MSKDGPNGSPSSVSVSAPKEKDGAKISKDQSSPAVKPKSAPASPSPDVSSILSEEYKKSLQQGQDLNKIHDILSDIRVLLEKSPQDQQVILLYHRQLLSL